MRDPLKDIFYLLPEESLKNILGDSSIDFEILLPVQMPEGTDSGKFSLMVQFSIDDVISAILKILFYDPSHSEVDYYKKILFSNKPKIKDDLLASALKKMDENEFSTAEIFLKILIELAEEGEDISFISFNLAISLEKQASLFISLDRMEEAQDKIKGAKELYHLFSSQSEDKEKSNEFDKLIALNLVQKMISQGREEEALVEISRIINEQQEDSSDALLLKGWILRKMKRYQEALECFHESILLYQPTVDILTEQFICYIHLKNYFEAEKVLNQALKLDEEDSRIYFNFGLLFYSTGEKGKALSYFHKGLSLSPEDQTALNFISVINEELKS